MALEVQHRANESTEYRAQSTEHRAQCGKFEFVVGPQSDSREAVGVRVCKNRECVCVRVTSACVSFLGAFAAVASYVCATPRTLW